VARDWGGRDSRDVMMRSTERSTRLCRGSASATRAVATDSFGLMRVTRVAPNSPTSRMPRPPPIVACIQHRRTVHGSRCTHSCVDHPSRAAATGPFVTPMRWAHSPYRLEGVGRNSSRCVRRVMARLRRSFRRSNHHVPRTAIAPYVSHGLDGNAPIQRHRPWCGSLRVVRRRQAPDQEYRETRNNVPSRVVGLMRKRAAGAFRKGHVPRPPPHGCGRRRRRSTRIPHVPRAHRFVSLDSYRDADGA
jgi:hypothetical protein